MLGIKGNVTGSQQVSNLLRSLEPKVFRPAARLLVSDCGSLVVKEARQRVRRRTGALAKAMGKRVKAVKNKLGYYCVAGPRRDPSAKKFADQMAQYKRGQRKHPPKIKFRRIVSHQGRDILVDPAKYAHLIEYGRRAVVAGTRSVLRKGQKVTEDTGKKVLSDGQTIFGPRVQAFPPDPFMRPAWATAEPQCWQIAKRRVKEAINKAKAMKVK